MYVSDISTYSHGPQRHEGNVSLSSHTDVLGIYSLNMLLAA